MRKSVTTYILYCPVCGAERIKNRDGYMEILRGEKSFLCFKCANDVKGANKTSFTKGQKPHNKGKVSPDATYNSIHWWIRRNYGSANKCQNIDCKGDCKRFDWALLPNRRHEHKKDNYRQLCRKCHKLLDYHKQKLTYVI